MQQFELPRYIEEEAKVLGPLGVKQFFILFGGVLACALFFFFFQATLAAILSLILMSVTAFLMMGKIEGRPAYSVVLGAIKFFWLPKNWVWQKPQVSTENIYYENTRRQAPIVEAPRELKKLSREELSELARQLDRQDSSASEDPQS